VCSDLSFRFGLPLKFVPVLQNLAGSENLFSSESVTFSKIQKIRWKLKKFGWNAVDVRKKQKIFGNTKFSRINWIIGRKFGNRLPAHLVGNSIEFCQKMAVEEKKSQKILAWPTLNLYITITRISF
jgi:hypothetical protein